MTRARLQKVLAAAGLGSRRACEELILSGRISVDGNPATKLGTTVDPDMQEVAIDGRKLKLPGKVYVLVNKPVGHVCSNKRDRTDRPLVTDLVLLPDVRLFSVGRLDVDSKGAIILTNDGDFANRISHPRYDVPKTYRVRVEGELKAETIEKLRKGVWLSEGKTTPTDVRVISSVRSHTMLRITLSEGKNRVIRRVFARLMLKVTELERTRIGPLTLGSLKPGQFRKLNQTEIKKLLAFGQTRRSRGTRRRTPPSSGPDQSRQEGKSAARPVTAPRKQRGLATKTRSPAAKSRSPAAKTRSPAAKSRSPAKSRATNTRSPAANTRSPAAKSRSPAAKSRSPAAKSRSPAKSRATNTRSKSGRGGKPVQKAPGKQRKGMRRR